VLRIVAFQGGARSARGFVANPRPIALATPNTTIQLGRGIDATWQGDIELANPSPNAIGDAN
jgi:hypothetical protein